MHITSEKVVATIFTLPKKKSIKTFRKELKRAAKKKHIPKYLEISEVYKTSNGFSFHLTSEQGKRRAFELFALSHQVEHEKTSEYSESSGDISYSRSRFY